MQYIYDMIFIAEPEDEATNLDAKSPSVCIKIYIFLYVLHGQKLLSRKRSMKYRTVNGLITTSFTMVILRFPIEDAR